MYMHTRTCNIHVHVAQLVEHPPRMRSVVGSNPTQGSLFSLALTFVSCIYVHVHVHDTTVHVELVIYNTNARACVNLVVSQLYKNLSHSDPLITTFLTYNMTCTAYRLCCRLCCWRRRSCCSSGTVLSLV